MIEEQTSSVLSALRTIGNERKGLDALEKAIRTTREGGLGAAFSEAVKTISAAPGRVIVTGIGKSGHIARKIAATLASTGEPAFFVHPAEASHGDLGMVQTGDVVLAISWSGETSELAAIVTFAKRYAIPLIAMTAEASSTLGRQADVCLTMPTAPEASPNGLEAPPPRRRCSSCSATRWQSRCSKAGFHRARLPRSSSGRQARGQAHACAGSHAHRRPDPRVLARARMAEAIIEMSSKGFGCVAALDDSGALVGIVTDGDLRHHLQSNFSLETPVADVMTRTPRTISPDALVAEALEKISRKGAALPVVENGAIVGIVHFHDLMRAGAL